MTEDRMALLRRAEKAGDTDFLRGLAREVVHELMEAEATSLCGAKRHERSEQRVDQRDGYRYRQWDTRLGSMELAVPPAASRELPPLVPRAAARHGAGADRGGSGGLRPGRVHAFGR